MSKDDGEFPTKHKISVSKLIETSHRGRGIRPPGCVMQESFEWMKDEADRIACRTWPDEDKMPKEKIPWLFSHFSFPMLFGSTAGPFGGIGGAAMTNFQMDVFSLGDGRAVVFADRRFWKTMDNFEWRQPDMYPKKRHPRREAKREGSRRHQSDS